MTLFPCLKYLRMLKRKRPIVLGKLKQFQETRITYELHMLIENNSWAGKTKTLRILLNVNHPAKFSKIPTKF